MTRDTLSSESLSEASRDRAPFSGHGRALGAAGQHREGETGAFLSHTGASSIVDPREHGYGEIKIAVAWDNVKARRGSFIRRLLCKAAHKGVDLDLGCLYELQDGSRGAVQGF